MLFREGCTDRCLLCVDSGPALAWKPACPLRRVRGEYLVTGPSKWVVGEMGVYAAKDIPKGTRLGRYRAYHIYME
jgi:hypothetical protein